jgi:hypothetical protein
MRKAMLPVALASSVKVSVASGPTGLKNLALPICQRPSPPVSSVAA